MFLIYDTFKDRQYVDCEYSVFISFYRRILGLDDTLVSISNLTSNNSCCYYWLDIQHLHCLIQTEFVAGINVPNTHELIYFETYPGIFVALWK